MERLFMAPPEDTAADLCEKYMLERFPFVSGCINFYGCSIVIIIYHRGCNKLKVLCCL